MTLRVGIIGSGGMGLTWAEVVSTYVEGAALGGIWGGTRADGLAATYGCTTEPSLEALLARPDIDAVVIATPLPTHHRITLAAARSGKHIFLEKPMAVTLGEADEMVDAAAAADVRFAVVSQHRFRRTPLAARRLIESGAIGDVRMVQAKGVAPWPTPAPGHVPWGELGYHVVDVLRWLVGSDVTRVAAQFTSFGPVKAPRQSAMAIYRFASGAMAQVWLTYEIPAPGLGSLMQYLITGSGAMIELDSYAAVRLSTPSGWEVIDEQPQGDLNDPIDPIRIATFVPQFQDFVAAVEDRRDPIVSGRDGRATMEMLLAAVMADATTEIVSLPGRQVTAALS